MLESLVAGGEAELSRARLGCPGPCRNV